MSYYLLYEVAVFGGVSRPEVSFGLSGLGISLFFLHMKFTFTTVYYIEFTRAAIPPPPPGPRSRKSEVVLIFRRPE